MGMSCLNMRTMVSTGLLVRAKSICRWALVLLAFTSVSGWSIPSNATADDESYCQRQPLRDYEGTLRDLPKINDPGESEVLSFGPDGARIALFSQPFNSAHLMAGAGGIGYTISGPFGGAAVSWNVSSRLLRLSQKGEITGVIQAVSGTLDHVSESADGLFVLRNPGRPGIYLYELSFEDTNGMPLDRFGRYLRVLRPVLRVRLGVKESTVSPGQVLVIRTENAGTKPIEYSPTFGLQRKGDINWKTVPVGSKKRIVPRESDGRGVGGKAHTLGAGETSECLRLKLPKNLSAGRYRIVRIARPFHVGPGKGKELQITAGFRVRHRLESNS